MNFDFLFGLITGFGIGTVLGVFMGVHHFRKGIEDGMRIHGLLDLQAETEGNNHVT